MKLSINSGIYGSCQHCMFRSVSLLLALRYYSIGVFYNVAVTVQVCCVESLAFNIGATYKYMIVKTPLIVAVILILPLTVE